MQVCRFTLACLVCIFVESAIAAGDREEVASLGLPPAVTSRIADVFPGADLLSANKETYDGKKCFVVKILYRGEVLEYYISPDGDVVLLKLRAFSVDELPSRLAGIIVICLFPGLCCALVARWLARTVRRKQLSPVRGWLVAFLGSLVGFCVLLLTVGSSSRNDDIVIDAIMSVVCSAISASISETMGILWFRDHRVCENDRRWAIRFCALSVGLVVLSMLVNSVGIEQQNLHSKRLAMRDVNS